MTIKFDLNQWHTKLVNHVKHNEGDIGIEQIPLTQGEKIDVLYLRSRHRWTPELEVSLIDKLLKKEYVNVMEFGCTETTGKALVDAVEAGVK